MVNHQEGSVRICDTSSHGEIVYDGRYCGACDHIKELEGQIEALKTEIEDWKDESRRNRKEEHG